MADGSVYAGISPDTGRAFYAAAQDAPTRMDWYQAKSYAGACTDHGHDDWRVPSRNEFSVLFNHRAAIGGFDEADWYWCSFDGLGAAAQGQEHTGRTQLDLGKIDAVSVRYVRG